MMRQIRREDLAPKSLDSKRLETIRETKQLKAKTLVSQWFRKPVKGLNLRDSRSRSPRDSVHEASVQGN